VLADTGVMRGTVLGIHPAEVHLFSYDDPAGSPDPDPPRCSATCTAQSIDIRAPISATSLP
jgi:hypothetical protein